MKHRRKNPETLTGAENAQHFADWCAKERAASQGRALEAYHVVLHRLASWGEGEVVNAGFDEPGAAQAARVVLAERWIGPCTHGRDPWDRCDDCDQVPAEVAMARAMRKPFVREVHAAQEES